MIPARDHRITVPDRLWSEDKVTSNVLVAGIVIIRTSGPTQSATSATVISQERCALYNASADKSDCCFPRTLINHDCGERARAGERDIIERPFHALPFSLHLDLLYDDCTMPTTVRSRAPNKKALCIGVEYRELAEKFSHLHLPSAARKDPEIMSGVLQGVS